MSQLLIVTTPQNSGLGTPLATAFNYTNSNFSQLFARFQVTPPSTLTGNIGDVPGMYAVDSNYFYYCFSNYTGNSTIWAQVTQVGNVSVNNIVNGTSNVSIVDPNGNVTIGIGSIANVANFGNTGVSVLGVVNATGNITAPYFIGNGSQLSGLPATYTDANVVTLLAAFGGNNVSTTGNITAANFIGSGAYLVAIPAANITGTVANAAYATAAGTANTVSDAAQPNITSVGTLSSVTVSGNVDGGNVNTVGQVSATGNIVTAGFFVGNFTGNVVATLTNIPGPGGAVVFNDGTGNAAATAGLVFDVSGPNLLTVLGSYSATANVTADVVTANFVTGTLTTAAQPNITSTGTLTSVTVSGNVTGGNLLSSGTVSTTGNVIGGNLLSSGHISTSGNVSGANINGGAVTGASVSVSGNVTGNLLTGTLTTAAQPNVTSVGSLTSLSVLGTTQSGNLRTSGLVSATGNITAAGNIRGGNLVVVNDVNVGGNVSATLFTAGSISMTGNVSTSANVVALANVYGNFFFGNGSTLSGVYTDANTLALLANLGSNNISTAGNVSAALFAGGAMTGSSISVTGNVSAASLIGNIATANQPTITTLGTLTALSVTGDINNSGNIGTTNLTATGNVSANDIIGNIATASQTNITAIGTLATLSVSGTITSGNLSLGTGNLTVGNIINANANTVGNIGSDSNYFNTVFAKATSAQYADLAENYVADTDYAPGTVVIFGGTQEITVTTEFADERVAGVVSANPAHLMNAGMPGTAIALRGRVPVRVIGPVVKGDSLVTSTTAGFAVSVGRNKDHAQAVFAKAIQTDIEPGEKTITAVIL